MKYMDMLPYQVRAAIDNNTPVVIPMGVVEYHAEHLPLGVDYFVAQETIDRVEKKHPDMIVMPPFYYGCASFAVAAPERKGTLHVDMAHMVPALEDIFRSLLRVGFRNIHCFVAHQGEQFEQGMPTDLAFRFAAKHVIFQWLEKESGEGWWGTEAFANYYEGANDPFKWIQVHHHGGSQEWKDNCMGDHAGKTETSETMVIRPELVQMEHHDESIWFSRPAKEASKEWGEKALQIGTDYLEQLIYG